MALIRYTVARNIPASKDGKTAFIAVALVQFENGHRTRLAIPEDLIRFAGEAIIDQEVRRACAL
jgi:hypothetical protein